MDWMYLFYFLLATLVFIGAQPAGRGAWNEEYTSLKQSKALLGVTSLGVALHHMAQKTCAPWHPSKYTVHGLDVFLSVGYMCVGVFLFCSGLGLYRSFKGKPGYLDRFPRRRILPLVIAFYLSEVIYTLVRLAMGEQMDLLTVLWYLSGLHMANFNAWYLVVIPFFYAAFWAAFRFCKREGMAILLVFLFALGYTVLGACIDHQSDWWIRGEWWYNSILLFPLGLLFGKYEQRVTAFLKKGYLFWLLLSFAAIFLLFWQSEWLNDNAWGFYGEYGDPLKVAHRLMSAGFQWLVAISYTAFCFLFMMKVKLGNRALGWLGGVTLEFYLMHGIFVELFGYSFLDIADSLVYIRRVPLYVAAVLGCSIPAALLFGFIWKKLVALTLRKNGGPADPPARKERAAPLRPKTARARTARRIVAALAPVLALALIYLALSTLGGDANVRVVNGREFRVPGSFTRKYSDSRYAVYEYAANDKRPGNLIIDAGIRDGIAGELDTVEEVLEKCTWLTDAEVYVNPQGVRMVRGFANYAGSPERRYYVESDRFMLLMCMSEDERLYDRDDCEAAIFEVAEGIRSVG